MDKVSLRIMIKKILIYLIKAYQRFVSPFLGSNCRFHPTCSDYSKEAIDKYGIVAGAWLSLKRISKCHPLGGSGLDPVPHKEK